MPMSNDCDVIIIGCGIAGSVTGALLSQMAHKRVLILEQSKQIGGRATSFRGEGIKSADEFRKTLGVSAHCWVCDQTSPDVDTMIKKKMLDGYIIEVGGRGAWYTNRGRVSQALAVFNKASIFYPNVGFVWHDHNWKPYNVGRKNKYGWMSDKDYAATLRIHKSKFQIGSIADAEKLDHVTLKDWVENISDSELANEFHYAMGTFQTIINDPALNSAGQNLKVFLQVQETGVHITNGSWGFAGAPGHRFIAEGFTSAVKESGGQIITGAIVKEIIISNGKITGVKVEIEGKIIEIKAPVIVCTAPPKVMLKLVPENLLPADLVKLARNVIHTAMVGGHFGMSKPLESFARIDFDPRAFFHTATLIPQSEGLFRGNVPLDGAILSNIAPTVAPEGKHLAFMISSILDYEAHDKKRLDMVIERILKFGDSQFPGWRTALDWMLFTVGDTCILWKHPEDEWVDVKCPTIEGLYFAGDTYGKRTNEGGIEGATHSGFICASEISGKDYLQLLPPVFR